MISDKETCCFLHIVKNVLSSEDYYLLPFKEYDDIQPEKCFMGYYDENYIYLVPKRIVYEANKVRLCCDAALEFNGLEPFNMKRILENLFALDFIKVHWILSKEVRYRPQKRVGKTKCRYITLIRSRVEEFFKEEQ